VAVLSAIFGLNLLTAMVPQRWEPAVNLAGATSVCWLATANGVSLEEQGIKIEAVPRCITYGAVLGAPAVAGLIAAPAIPALRNLYRGRHITSAPTGSAIYELLFRIPIATALSEELMFRGALWGLLSQRQSPLKATIVSSGVFGLWHIAPLHRLIKRELGRGAWEISLVGISGSVLSTAVAGLLLAWVRSRSGSVIAPWLVHSAANTAAYARAWFLARSAEQIRRPDNEES
jgi:membrane protease YdiL (CAAX protease family)